jgi:polar amino acid transport system substrate-binding protein
MCYHTNILVDHKISGGRRMKMKKLLAVLLVFCMVFALAACGNNNKTSSSEGTMKYAVESGSAGQAAADEKGFEYTEVESQADALMEVSSGNCDAAIIDLLMAGAMIGEGTSYPDLVHTDELTTEEYGVGCRKGSDLASYINEVFSETYKDGSMQEIAEKYGVQESLVEQPDATYEASDSDSDVAAIQKKGKLIVGVTDFAPMDYKDDNGEWIGFDADMARVVAEKLGVDIEIVEINWDNKIMELKAGNIDVVWNGMTLTDEVTSSMECTNAYCNNAQVVVVPSSEK